MTDYNGLRAKAEAATPGPYIRVGKRGVATRNWNVPSRIAQWVIITPDEEDAEYIAAVSPDVVLALLNRIAELESIWLGRTEARNDRT